MIKTRILIILLTAYFPLLAYAQEQAFNSFLSDSIMRYGAVSFRIIDASDGSPVFSHDEKKSLIPASVMKLVTTSAAIELLGPDYTYKTEFGYRGKISRLFRILEGDIVIHGGGDPVLGSGKFPGHYEGFADKWVEELKKLKIKEVTGRVITDDSYYDYLPVPAKWLWEDAGNYYGAGAYGLSIFDNTYEIHLTISPDTSRLYITGITPAECTFEFANWLVAAGTADKGYVFAAPYSTNGWLAGSIPSNLNDFTLKASIADPPLIMAKLIDQKMHDTGIDTDGDPTTARLLKVRSEIPFNKIAEITSPPLSHIIEVLNHESVNLYAEHLVKEIGKVYRKNGSTEKGIECILEYLELSGIDTDGIFIVDGSGLSPLNAINAESVTALLYHMKHHAKYFDQFYSSLPDAGKEGTLKRYFQEPEFDGNMKAKSGSMTRVRSYAGFLKADSGRELIFCMIVNNYSGPHQAVIAHVEEILRETIKSN
ncbi:MAG: D-alanyl-D-alanine carboxypeptidase/D-alanyl-D-alanine-endopeptidase [Bacteroidales bacterium]|nr:D-alanyl-D-alanine carboxypeptidase/D-alanyl-D-alanine-endopeptidase [Bacteroidales bacterium]